MTDQISFLPMLEPHDTSFEDNERKAEQICDDEFERADGDIVKYVAACVDRFDKELTIPYDLRDDDRVKNEDVAWCMACLFLMLFVEGFGCILLWIIYKHGKVVERNEAREIRRKIKPRWWEEIK